MIQYLENKGYEVLRIKEKPAGGFDNKKKGYKGDFLIKKKDSNDYYVVECKGLKTNSEFRSAKTDENDHIKKLPKKNAYNTLKKFYNVNKKLIYDKGKRTYLSAKEKWENNNPDKSFPDFKWEEEMPGPDNADLTPYFENLNALKTFIDTADEKLLYETAFRDNKALYKILQTHEPSNRTDPYTGIHQAAPLVSDFSIMAVDLFQRTGKHQFVFMNPNEISHSPSSPNHLYQNYIIDIIIPEIKDELCITPPWYKDINECIEKTSPKTVEYDASQIDYREA